MATIQTVETYADFMVKLGLATPSSRGFVAGSLATGLAYIGKYPSSAFREDGSLKPIGFTSSGPDPSTTDFLRVPVGVALAVFLFT